MSVPIVETVTFKLALYPRRSLTATALSGSAAPKDGCQICLWLSGSACREPGAGLLAVVRAFQVAPLSQRALPHAVRPAHAKLRPGATPARDAAVRDPPGRAHHALRAPLEDFPRDGRVRLSERPRDAFQSCAPLEHVLDLQALRGCDVSAHGGPLVV